jgi:hypothetical protein
MKTPSEKASALVAMARQTAHIPVSLKELAEAAYTVSEGGQWPDGVDSVSSNQILLCWQLVEWIKANGGKLPDGYRL